ncbi:MAG: hypothetical protein V3T31_11715 [candidate division Zixibacteria bacterium]
MTRQSVQPRQWALLGIVFSLCTLVTYLLPTQVPLPIHLTYLLFMAFGPFFSAAILSIYHYMKPEGDSPWLTIGTVWLIIGGALNTMMAAMQGALRMYMFDLERDEAMAKVAWKMGLHAGNAIQLGADVAWDYFVLPGLILWGVAFLSHQRFGKWFGWPAIIIGTGGMVLNCWTFPTPPGNAGLFDGGPLVGIWFGVITIQLLRHYIKMPKTAVASSTIASALHG